MYKLLLNISRKCELMDTNLLQCDTLVAVLLLVAVAQQAIGPLTKMHNKKNKTSFARYF